MATSTTSTATNTITKVSTDAAANQLKKMRDEVASLMLLGNGDQFALCLDPASPNYQKILFMHEGVKDWVVQRPASEQELARGAEVLAHYKEQIAAADAASNDAASSDTPAT